jgi:hypothetical protein
MQALDLAPLNADSQYLDPGHPIRLRLVGRVRIRGLGHGFWVSVQVAENRTHIVWRVLDLDEAN